MGNSTEKNDQIVDGINRIGHENRHFWTGLTDLEEEGVFRFESDGSEPAYTNWYNGEPDNHNGGDCVRLKSLVKNDTQSIEWKLADFPCTSKKYDPFTMHAICESDREEKYEGKEDKYEGKEQEKYEGEEEEKYEGKEDKYGGKAREI